MNNWIYLAAAIAIGAGISFQPPINGTMARTLGSPLLAATLSMTISLIVVIPLWLLIGKGGGDFSQIKALPWWVLIGGVLGVMFVAGSIVVAPVTGVALFFVCVVAGQLIGSTFIDQIGAFGLEAKPVNPMKIIGLVLVLAGAALVQLSNN